MTFATESPITAVEAESSFAPPADHIVQTIQTVIASMDADNSALENQTEDTWKFKYGTVEVVVNITGTSPSDTFTVFSIVLSAPFKDEEKLNRWLLEKNATDTFEARYAIQNDQVLVLSSRAVEDLSPAEISRIITIVAAIADDNDEFLEANFKA
ncbi:YbjN domain-containing protein [Pseudanabaena mucicola]|uniref:YbjN domain-containing protein n=1 Tax=Pseudanabaena mucicola FACHB-723 TaxID=2692860 RepID=A0ABR8A1Q4_9CYAN|nr:YbjN domain-containing protein [Pseudanabaena mucicola]MBD2189481.1 YbjN domain-containing protein [Pseudanabaena mucicola FACHB-723]